MNMSPAAWLIFCKYLFCYALAYFDKFHQVNMHLDYSFCFSKLNFTPLEVKSSQYYSYYSKLLGIQYCYILLTITLVYPTCSTADMQLPNIYHLLSFLRFWHDSILLQKIIHTKFQISFSLFSNSVRSVGGMLAKY